MADPEPAEAGAEAAEQANVEDARHTPVIEARLAALTALFGERFDDAQRAHLRRDLAREVGLGEQLRAAALTNADEPEIVFIPYRAGDQD